IIVAADTTKTKSSMRTLPLVQFVKNRLLAIKAEQDNNRRLCGRSYNKEYLGYVCINEIGDLIKPHYVTEQFPKLLEVNGFRHIRFHDLWHSCVGLMLANGVPMKQIQEWLGHSDFSTTANIYAHLDYSSKLSSADAMLTGLGIGDAW
ncbi:MAG: site-specific integrase, partial [Clostridiales bacterium]|nr:site-specific integrase [Clostridiales bacterium]